jgi:hypothetical protein
MYDFPSSWREKYTLNKFSTLILSNTLELLGVTRLGAGPRIAFNLGL